MSVVVHEVILTVADSVEDAHKKYAAGATSTVIARLWLAPPFVVNVRMDPTIRTTPDESAM